MHWRDTHSQSEESSFSHPMILKMLIVFHCLKHNKQTRKRDPANKQSQSVFSAANATQWEQCDWYTCQRFDGYERWQLCIFVFVLNFFLCAFSPLSACRFVCRLLHVFSTHKTYLHLCVCVEPLCVWLLNAVTGDVISGPGPVHTHINLQSLPCRLQMSACKPAAVFSILSFSTTGLTTEVFHRGFTIFGPLSLLK